MIKRITACAIALMLVCAALPTMAFEENPLLPFLEYNVVTHADMEMVPLYTAPDETADVYMMLYPGAMVTRLYAMGEWVYVHVGPPDMVGTGDKKDMEGFMLAEHASYRTPAIDDATGMPMAEVTLPTGEETVDAPFTYFEVWPEQKRDREPAQVPLAKGTKVAICGQMDDAYLVYWDGGYGIVDAKHLAVTEDMAPYDEGMEHYLIWSLGFGIEAQNPNVRDTSPGAYVLQVSPGETGTLRVWMEGDAPFERTFEVTAGDHYVSHALMMAEGVQFELTNAFLHTASATSWLTNGRYVENPIESGRILIGLQEAPGRYGIRMIDGAQKGYFTVYEKGYDEGKTEKFERVNMLAGKMYVTSDLAAGQILEVSNCIVWAIREPAK